MKKLSTILALSLTLIGLAQAAPAKMSANAIGVRLGEGSSANAEVSYQRALGANRLEVDVGWDGGDHWSNIGVSALYHWTWNITSGLNWYVGPGGGLGLYTNDYNDNDGISLAFLGQLGIEFNFQELGAPLNLSLDIRPSFGVFHGLGFNNHAAISVRYLF